MSNQPKKTNWVFDISLTVFAIGIATCIFIIDIQAPAGIAVGAAYAFVIFFSWLLQRNNSSIYAAIICTILVIVGFIYSKEIPELSQFAGINRILSIIVIWVCAALVTIAKRSFAGLEEARDTLEEKVETRTSELRKSEKRIRYMIEEIQDYSIILLSPEGFIDNWNAGAKKIKGYEKYEIIGEYFNIFYTEEDKNNGKAKKLLQTAQQKGRAQDEGWRVRKDGSMFWGLVSITAIRNDEGEIIGFSKVTRDLTRQRQVQKMEKSHAVLAAKNQELEQFTYIASHDLQEPLTTVKSFVEVLNEEYQDTFDEDGKQYLFFINQAVSRMGNLVNDLLSYSRVGANKEIDKVNCNDVINTVLKKLEAKISEQKTIINIDNLPIINTYQKELELLFNNLISNALKFHKKGNTPEISISCNEKRDVWQFGVKDNGIGIAPEQQSKIFEIFKRLHNKRTYEGTGIGLALCNKIVELHGGKIWVESTINQGCTFYFTIPK